MSIEQLFVFHVWGSVWNTN